MSSLFSSSYISLQAKLAGIIFGGIIGSFLTQNVYSQQFTINESEGVHNTQEMLDSVGTLKDHFLQKSVQLSLSDAINQGLVNSPGIKEAISLIKQYEWDLKSNQRLRNPNLELSNGSQIIGYQATKTEQRKPGSKITQKTDSLLINPELSLSVDLIDLGREAKIKSAESSLQRQKLLYSTSTRNIILDIQNSYYDLQSSKQLIDTYKKLYNSNKELLDLQLAQIDNGLVNLLDVEQQKILLYKHLNNLIEYHKQYISNSVDLSNYIGLKDGVLVVPTDTDITYGEWNLNLEQTIQKAIAYNEYLRASYAAEESTRWLGLSYIRSYLPVVALELSHEVSITDQTSDNNLWSNTDTTTSNIGLTLNWKLLDGGVKKAMSNSTKHKLEQQQARTEKQKLSIIAESTKYFTSYQLSKLSIIMAEKAYESAKSAVTASRARYEAGVGDMTSLIQSSEQFLETLEHLNQEKLSYKRTLASLNRITSNVPLNSY